MVRIATSAEEEKLVASTKANVEAFKVLINLSEHDPIVTELIELNAPSRLARYVIQLYKRVPLPGKSPLDDSSIESAIVVLANLTRYIIGINAMIQTDRPVEVQGVQFLLLTELYLQNPTDSRLDYVAAIIANCCAQGEGRSALLSDKGAAMGGLIQNLFGPSNVRAVYTLVMMQNCVVDKRTATEWIIKTRAYVDCFYAYILLCEGVRDAAFASYWLQKIVNYPINTAVEDRYKKMDAEYAKRISKLALEVLTGMATCEEVKKDMEKNQCSGVVALLIEKTKSAELTEAAMLLNSKLVQ